MVLGLFEEDYYIKEISLERERIPSFAEYPFQLPAVTGLSRLPMHPKVTFLVGENGSGKSTIIEAIAAAYGFNAEGGSIHFNFSTRNSLSSLYEYIKLKKGLKKPRDGYFLRAESFHNVATNIEELDAMPSPSRKIIESYGGRSLHEQSHGESFMALFLNRFGGNGIYILDEPEAALSPSRQMTFISRMHELIRNGSQFIIATHSPILMSYPDAVIYSIDESGIHEKAYEETDHFIITKQFANNHKKMIRMLIE